MKVRSDSAAYQQECLERWHNCGWEFAISADMSQGLKREIKKLPDDAWHLWRMEKDGVIKEWADVPYVLARHYERKDSYPYRYVAVRLRHQHCCLSYWNLVSAKRGLTPKTAQNQ